MSCSTKTIYVTVATVSADNPASNALGGFKEGFTAFRHCRQCMGTSEECKHEVNRLSRALSDTTYTKWGYQRIM